jgi:hypothetical protein
VGIAEGSDVGSEVGAAETLGAAEILGDAVSGTLGGPDGKLEVEGPDVVAIGEPSQRASPVGFKIYKPRSMSETTIVQDGKKG